MDELLGEKKKKKKVGQKRKTDVNKTDGAANVNANSKKKDKPNKKQDWI